MTGVATFKSAVYNEKQKDKPLQGGNIYEDTRDSAKKGRPARAYKDDITMAPVRREETDQRQREEANANAYRIAADLEDRKQRGQVASRVRRSARADKPGTKGGTLTSGGLGSAGGGQLSFASLLGL